MENISNDDSSLGSAFLFVAVFGFVARLYRNDEHVHRDKAASMRTIFYAAKLRFQAFLKNNQYTDPTTANSSLSVDRTLNFNHQVAGHTSEPLRGFLGKVLKPMVKGDLFLRELRLYEELAESPFSDYCNHLPQSFVPHYTGLVLVEIRTDPSIRQVGEKNYDLQTKYKDQVLFESIAGEHKDLHQRGSAYRWLINLIHRTAVVVNDAADRSSCAGSLPISSLSHEMDLTKHVLPHLVLEDLTLGYCAPCVIDIKMGQQTFEPTASPYKKHREVLKCPYQATTGFRITGMKVFNIRSQSYVYKEKQFGRSLAPDQLCDALCFFFHNGSYLRRDVVISVIQQLEQILVWFQCQDRLHFYCSSLLIIYDGSPTATPHTGSVSWEADTGMNSSTLPLRSHFASTGTDLVKVKMIDFAHTLPSPGGVDLGYIVGLRNLSSRLYEVLQNY